MEDRYVFLTGAVTIDADAPEDWRGEAVLPFWQAPNDERWGDQLSRVLYHEAIHFWQFLSSRYLAEVVTDEWERLLQLEAANVLLPEGPRVAAYRESTHLFSPADLVECWARYWDVHTRGPVRIIAEEGIPADDLAERQRQRFYRWSDYDLVMTSGESCELYAAPFRWLLDKAGNSLVAHVIFPILLAAAFTTADPVRFFSEAVNIALTSSIVVNKIMSYAGDAINSAWLECWDIIASNVIAPFIPQSGAEHDPLAPFQKLAWNVINDGPLKSHPIFAQHLIKAHPSNYRIYFRIMEPLRDPALPREYGERYLRFLKRAVSAAPIFTVHGLPGQPFFRTSLGTLVPPPVIAFRNYVWYAPRVLDVGTNIQAYRAKDGATFEDVYSDLERRVRRFKLAQEAVRYGLAPDALNEASGS